MSMIENVCEKISNTAALKLDLDDDRKAIVHYGLFAMIQIGLSIVLTLIVGFILGVFVESIIITLAIVTLRKNAGGIHAKTPTQCLLIGTVITSIGAIIASKLVLNIDTVLLIGGLVFIYSLIIILIYAPSDSVAKPIKEESERKRLKKRSVLVLCVFYVIVFLCLARYNMVGDYRFITYSICIYMGMAWQSFTLTKIAHKIFKF